MGRCEVAACTFISSPSAASSLVSFRKAQFAGAPVLKRVKCSAADSGLRRECGLAKLEAFAAPDDLRAYRGQGEHMPNILATMAICKAICLIY